MSDIPDPFGDNRRADGVLSCPFTGEEVLMILRHGDVKRAAKDWETFSSDAPFRVPVPSEENLRTMRQLPIEVDPPEQTDYRKLVEPFFQRAKEPAFQSHIENLIRDLLQEAMALDSIEIVNGFALPLQSRALAVLLNLPQSQADTWIGWGIHVFHGAGGNQGAGLEAYHNAQLDRAEANPGDDFFSLLTQAIYRGRRLTRDEMMGFANLTFAGGRDTIIHTVACVIHYLGTHPESLEFLREDPSRIIHASEEFFRVFMPLTHIGRVCPVETEVHGVTVKAGHRVSLGWASANLDEEAFESPRDIRLDRKPNPHVSFGFGAHLCLGAPHSRTVLRALLSLCCEHIKRITILDAHDRIEHTAAYDRPLGFESLTVAMEAIE